ATKDLERDIRNKGFDTHALKTPAPLGTTPTTGGYKEGDRKVEEDSVTVSAPKNAPLPPPDEIVKFFIALAEKYQQMGVIIKLPGEEAHEYTTNFHGAGPGNRIPYGNAERLKDPMYYTRPRDRNAKTHGTDG